MPSGLIADLKRAYRVTRDYGRLTDTPTDRLKVLLFRLFASSELPAIMFGISISATITSLYGTTPAGAALSSWVVFAFSVIYHVLAQEFIDAVTAARREFADERPRGIY